MIIVNGLDLTSLCTYEVGIMDLDSENSVRNARGQMMRDRIATKRKLELSFSPLTGQSVSSILLAISPIFFWVKYLDPQTGGIREIECYAGDRKLGLIDSKNQLWTNFKFNLIER